MAVIKCTTMDTQLITFEQPGPIANTPPSHARDAQGAKPWGVRLGRFPSRCVYVFRWGTSHSYAFRLSNLSQWLGYLRALKNA